MQRMKKIEVVVLGLEETKQVLITRSESLTDLSKDATNSGQTMRGSPGVYVSHPESMTEGLAGASEMLEKIEHRLEDAAAAVRR